MLKSRVQSTGIIHKLSRFLMPVVSLAIQTTDFILDGVLHDAGFGLAMRLYMLRPRK